MSRKLRLPTYSLHRASGQARVRIDGREIYLGPFDSPESHRRYRELVDEWINRKKSGRRIEISIGELTILYLQHAQSYYVKDGKETSQVHMIRQALRPPVKLFRNELVADFGPLKLQRVREEYVRLGVARVTVNRYVSLLVGAFRWGVAHEHVPATTLVALEAVPGLRAGRCKARETEPVSVVPRDVVLKTLPHLPVPNYGLQHWLRRIWNRVRGLAKPLRSEILNVTPDEIHTRSVERPEIGIGVFRRIPE